MKTFTFAGTSVKNGETKVRWANDAKRVTAMEKDGQTNIVMVELPVAMNKLHAAKFIGTLVEFQAADQQTAIADFIAANDDGTELVIEFQDSEQVVEHVDEQAVVEEA